MTSLPPSQQLSSDPEADRVIKAAGGIAGIEQSEPLTFRLTDGALLRVLDRSARTWEHVASTDEQRP